MVGVMLPQQAFRAKPFSDPRYPGVDTLLVVADRKNPGFPSGESEVGIPFDSVSQGWIPLAMMIALSLATPLPFSKRLQALLAGTIVIQLVIAATVLVSVSFTLIGEAGPAFPRFVLMLAKRLLVENIWFSFVLPFLFWAGWVAWAGIGSI